MVHLALLNFSCHLSSYLCSWLRSSWGTLQSWTLAICLYITQSSANRRTVDDVCSAKSLMKIIKGSGPNTEPCGTPDFTAAASDVSPSTSTLCVRPSKNDLIQLHLPSCVNSKFCLFVDDCLLYREIKNNHDQIGKLIDKHCCSYMLMIN